MTEPRKIIIACMDAEEAYQQKRNDFKNGLAGGWRIRADKRDYRGTQWVYKAWHPDIPGCMIEGTRDDIVQGIMSKEMEVGGRNET